FVNDEARNTTNCSSCRNGRRGISLHHQFDTHATHPFVVVDHIQRLLEIGSIRVNWDHVVAVICKQLFPGRIVLFIEQRCLVPYQFDGTKYTWVRKRLQFSHRSSSSSIVDRQYAYRIHLSRGRLSSLLHWWFHAPDRG